MDRCSQIHAIMLQSPLSVSLFFFYFSWIMQQSVCSFEPLYNMKRFKFGNGCPQSTDGDFLSAAFTLWRYSVWVPFKHCYTALFVCVLSEQFNETELCSSWSLKYEPLKFHQRNNYADIHKLHICVLHVMAVLSFFLSFTSWLSSHVFRLNPLGEAAGRLNTSLKGTSAVVHEFENHLIPHWDLH